MYNKLNNKLDRLKTVYTS